jgi:heme/copper-type cytochrome/quinol oxidase subunit 1
LSVAGFMVGLGFLVFIINVVISVKSGDKVTDDPWPTTKGAEAADPAVQPAE